LAAASYKPDIGGETYLRCYVCKVNFLGPKEWLSMCPALVIRKKTSRQGLSATIEPEEAAATSRSEYCGLCRSSFLGHMDTAYANEKTQAKGRFAASKDTGRRGKDKHGVTVSDGLIWHY